MMFYSLSLYTYSLLQNKMKLFKKQEKVQDMNDLPQPAHFLQHIMNKFILKWHT